MTVNVTNVGQIRQRKLTFFFRNIEATTKETK